MLGFRRLGLGIHGWTCIWSDLVQDQRDRERCGHDVICSPELPHLNHLLEPDLTPWVTDIFLLDISQSELGFYHHPQNLQDQEANICYAEAYGEHSLEGVLVHLYWAAGDTHVCHDPPFWNILEHSGAFWSTAFFTCPRREADSCSKWKRYSCFADVGVGQLRFWEFVFCFFLNSFEKFEIQWGSRQKKVSPG